MDPLWNLLAGDLSDEVRVWSAFAPAFVPIVYALVGLAVYLVRGPIQDAEVESRGDSPLLGMRLRLFFVWLTSPIFKALHRAHVPASAITLLSALLAVAAGIAAGFGRFTLAGWLYLATGLCDFIDGRLARVSGTAGPRGAVLDSVIDRYAEGALLVGLTWYYRDSSWILVALLGLTGSFLVPYVRARAEGAGATMKNVGLMQRPERVVILGLATALAPVADIALGIPPDWPQHVLALAALAFLAATSHFTAVQRLVFVMQSLPGKQIKQPTVAYRVRRALVLCFESGTFILLVVFGMSWIAAAFVACAIGLAAATSDPDRFRRVFVAVSSAGLLAGGMWLLMTTGAIAPVVAWIVVRVAVHLMWVVPIELARHLVDPDPAAKPR
jgi:phosphatidylglycerophosphate synthase